MSYEERIYIGVDLLPPLIDSIFYARAFQLIEGFLLKKEGLVHVFYKFLAVFRFLQPQKPPLGCYHRLLHSALSLNLYIMQ